MDVTSRASLRHPSLLTLGAVGLVGLLALLAVLQYRWAGELSEADLDRLRASARERAGEFARQFDREITRAFLWFSVDPGEVRRGQWKGLLQAYDRWQKQAPHPGLVKGVYALAVRAKEPPVQLVLDATSARVEERAWPSDLAPLSSRLAGDVDTLRSFGRERPGLDPIDEATAAVVIPVLSFDRPPDGPVRQRPAGFQPVGYAVVRLDLAYIRDAFLPSLERRFFDEADGFDYCLQVFSSGEAGTPFYTSANAGRPPATPDASVRIFAIRFDPHNRDLLEGTDPAVQGPWRRLFGMDHRPPPSGRPPQWPRIERRHRDEGTGRWRASLWNRAGGLPELVAVARRRNLAIGFGVLLLLGASVGLLVTAARRAERLARRQMEFVAGVTHELRTPLAVIRSAGENLADGLVGDVSQVRSYGALVRDEGRRLTELVEEVLELAGAESGRPAADPRPVRVDRLVDDAIKGCEAELRAAGLSVQCEVPEGLPPLQGDETSLRRALRNLLDNAIKYGGDTPWIAVRARRISDKRGPRIAVTVEDRGLGIPSEDLPHIFEPFYRGRQAVARRIRGSGLGLSLVQRIVESHGGRVAVEAGRERGTAITLTLPADEDATPSSASSTLDADAKAHPAR